MAVSAIFEPVKRQHKDERESKQSKLLQVAENSDVIFIAVKPQYVSLVLQEAKPHLKKDTIIVSIAAGVPLAAMKVRVTHLFLLPPVNFLL